MYTAFAGPSSYAYPEVVVGATYDRVSARLHYSPNYYGRGADAVYGEVDGALRLYDHVQAVAHATGAPWTDARDYYGNSLDTVFDPRVGVAFDFAQLNIQLSWVGINESSVGYGLPACEAAMGRCCRCRGFSDHPR